jgi:ATPase subunit of ABC transporter with duplicated ATPase domains
VQEEYEHLGGYALESQAREVLHGLGFKDDQIDGDVGALSGGWKMRVALARVLLGMPDVLLMDEPTNHLDIESIIWLEQFLKSFPGALLMTSHDREFMNRLVSKIAEIDGGEIITYSGDYDFYERERAVRESNQQAAFARQQSMLAKEQRFIDRFRTHAAKGERSWNGVAILARNIERDNVPVLTCTSLPGSSEDHQARYIEAAVQGVLITSIYLPNGNPQPGPKFNYKLAWFERLIAHAGLHDAYRAAKLVRS